MQAGTLPPYRVIIRTRNELTEPFIPTGYASLDALVAEFGVQSIVPLFDASRGNSTLKQELGLGQVYVLTLPSSGNLPDALLAFSADSVIEYAEFDFIGYGAGVPDDQWFDYQWNLHNTGQSGGEPDADVDAPEAWDVSLGATSTVLAIIDTGLDLDHPDLAEKVVPGYDFVNGDAIPEDDHDHGTHVAGIAAAVTDNVTGMAGVCPECRIMPIKALNSENWGYYSWWADAIEYAVDNGAHVINMSMGGIDDSQVLHDAVLYAYHAGVPIVSAMMNDGDSTPYYPAVYTETIAVGATDRYDHRWVDSSFGDHVDLVAPGASILGTIRDDTYAFWDGTSMAAPHVAGVLGLIHSVHPGYTIEELRAILRATADDQVGPPNEDKQGWDRYFGSGRLNAAQAVQYAAIVPPAEVSISGPVEGLVLAAHTFIASAGPVTATQPITFTWQATGQAPVAHTGGLSDTVTFAWPISGTQGITVTVTNAGGAVSGTHVITIGTPLPGAVITVCQDGDCDYDNIQDGVDAASEDNVIKVAAGVYTDVNDHGGLAQVVYVDKNVTIRGGYTSAFTDPPDPDANPTTLDAQGSGRVLYVTGEVSPTIEGLRITGGDATGLNGDPSGGDAGGGVYVIHADAILVDNQVFSNTARWGGGFYLRESDAVLTGNTIAANAARWGGGLFLREGDATLSGNTVTANTADRDGGGLYLQESAPTLDGNTITTNIADKNGGGLHLWESDATLTNNICGDNQASTAGSGIYIRDSSPYLLHTTVARNGSAGLAAVADGSGVCVANNSIVTLSNTILVSHTVGITVTGDSTATLEATLWGQDAWANTTDWGGAGAVVTGTPAYNTWGAPAFLASGAGDYHIGPGSDAIDAGVDVGVTSDVDGDPRPVGARCDVGADEFPAALSVTSWAAPNFVRAGAQLTYTIRITNTGVVDLHTTVTDTLPERVTPGGTLTWTPVITAPGGVWTAGVVVTVEAGYAGPLTNVVQVTTEEGATNVYTVTAISLAPYLEVSEMANDDLARAGTQLTYTIRVTNAGTMDLHATIADTLPDHVLPGGILTWTPTIAASGGVWVETVPVIVETDYAGPLTNVVQVTTEEGVTGTHTSTVTVIVAEELVTVEPSEGGTIVVTGADGMTVTIEVPPGAVTEPTQLAYVSVLTVTGSPAGFAFAGRAFRLEAYRHGTLHSSLVFERPVTVTVYYAEPDVSGLDENTLELRHWNGSVWSTDGITVVERNVTSRRLVTWIEHPSEFATFAKEQQEGHCQVYLPLLLRQHP
ncbi:MAG: S8 family serine peptidase [Chloroflexota bacterium]|nr:S8 family serine peptidase [Chloroflexota bacterium]